MLGFSDFSARHAARDVGLLARRQLAGRQPEYRDAKSPLSAPAAVSVAHQENRCTRLCRQSMRNVQRLLTVTMF